MSSCRNKESALINIPASLLWASVRTLDFRQLNPDLVKSCSLLIPSAEGKVSLEGQTYLDVGMDGDDLSGFGCPLSIGSLRHVVYKDGAEFVFRIIELSDVQGFVTCELIQTDSTVNVSAVQHTFQVIEITETRQCVITWTTEFSSDVDQHVYSDCKYKKLDAFKAMRLALGI